MKKFYLLFGLAACLCLSAVRVIPAVAYTEEEKQMAKDWLSSHGYSPDWGGANQAYQDYLDGKIDMSAYGLGPPPTQAEPQTEAPEEPHTERPKKKTEKDKKSPDNKAEAPAESEYTDGREANPAETSEPEVGPGYQGEVSGTSETENENESEKNTEISGNGRGRQGKEAPETENKQQKEKSGEHEADETETGTENFMQPSGIQWMAAVVMILFIAVLGSAAYVLIARRKM